MNLTIGNSYTGVKPNPASMHSFMYISSHAEVQSLLPLVLFLPPSLFLRLAGFTAVSQVSRLRNSSRTRRWTVASC